MKSFPLITMHADLYERRFLARKMSAGFIFKVITIILVLVIPFITTYSSGKFWYRSGIEFEQPNVIFKNKVFAELLLADNQGNIIPQTYETSNVKAINSNSQNQLAPLILQSYGQDKNDDHRVEQWNITVGFRLPQNTQLAAVDLIAAFSYETSSYVNMQMEGLAHVHIDSYQLIPIKSMRTVGTLDLVQKEAIREVTTNNKLVKTLYETSVFDKLETVTANALLQEYYQRNETTKYSYQAPVIEYGQSDTVQLHMHIKVPQKQEIHYVSTFWQLLKFAWCQYFLVAIFWYLVLYEGFFGYLVMMRVFESVEVCDIDVNNLQKLEK